MRERKTVLFFSNRPETVIYFCQWDFQDCGTPLIEKSIQFFWTFKNGVEPYECFKCQEKVTAVIGNRPITQERDQILFCLPCVLALLGQDNISYRNRDVSATAASIYGSDEVVRKNNRECSSCNTMSTLFLYNNNRRQEYHICLSCVDHYTKTVEKDWRR